MKMAEELLKMMLLRLSGIKRLRIKASKLPRLRSGDSNSAHVP